MAPQWMLFLLLIFQYGNNAMVVVIDLKQENENSTTHIHCLTDHDVIQIKDPFDRSERSHPKFVALQWFQYSNNFTKEVGLILFLESETKLEKTPKFIVYDYWGLQINNVSLNDSATYMAKLEKLDRPSIKSIKIIVASAPKLESETLSILKTVSEDKQTITLKCGKITSFGVPPVPITIKAENGAVLPTTFTDGYLTATITAREAEHSKFTCEIDRSSPAAGCIKTEDKYKWAQKVNEPDESISAGMYAGIAVAVVALVIVIAIIIYVIITKRSKSRKIEKKSTENTHEDHSQNKATPLLKDQENPYDVPRGPQKPIYKGPSGPSPYMVSKVSPDIDDHDGSSKLLDKDKEHSNNNAPARPKSGKFFSSKDDKAKKKYEEENIKKRKSKDGMKNEEKEVQNPPRAKPRSIFLNSSMEELDKINRAVAGGDGSGAGTQV